MSNPKEHRGYILPYSRDYEDACFTTWYKAGKPALISQIQALFSPDEMGRVPSRMQLKQYWLPSWRQRADILDAESNNVLDKSLIQARVEMLEKQADLGQKLQQLGMEYFDDHPVSDDAVALRMIVQGVEMERNSRGLSVALQRISSMSDETLQNELNKQLSRYKESHGEIVDGVAEEIDDTELEESEPEEDA